MRIGVFHSCDPVIEVPYEWCERLKRHAFESDRKRARLCLHRDAHDRLHEMLVVFHRDTLIRPHRHREKSESFHLVFGDLDILLFDESGRATRRISLGEPGSGKSGLYRLSTPVWHTVIVHSEYAGIHEVTNGPFQPEDGDYAPWSPASDAELRNFLARSNALLPSSVQPFEYTME